VVQSVDKKYSAYVGRIEYAGSGNKARLYDILFIATTSIGPARGGSEEAPTVVTAQVADYDDGIWKLHNAIVHEYSAHGLDERHMRLETMSINFRIAERAFNALYLQMPLYSNTSSSSAQELYTRISQQRKSGSVNKRDLLDFHFKLSVPFSCAVFALACPPLSLRFARAGNFMGVLLSIILVFVYWNALLAAKILGTKYADSIPPVAAAWGQNLVFAALGVYYLWKQE
jgi:lipopolysaccharide export LptBFGC system permease protein LptF